MASWAIRETFHRVAVQPGSTPKGWDRKELARCYATRTGIKTKVNLEGEIHPALNHWVATEPELRKELEQPLLLASKILEAIGLPWASDFLIDDIFDAQYPGRAACHDIRATSAYEQRGTPYSIVRHRRAPWTTKEKRTRWIGTAREALRKEFPKLVQWQIDYDIFQKKGWNGYTCRHPRRSFHLDDLDKHETIEKFDSFSLHERSRNLTILVMAEYPARMMELRGQGKEQSEEYLLTAFMATVTILHELGHAIYWKDRRALTRDLCEPFYGADLEMELGDSFVAAIFGGWVPVSIRELDRLKRDFSFADGVAWRQALNWDHHRIRPKYRAHYSIRVDYIARLFQEESWSTVANLDEAAALIRPPLLTGSNSIALRSLNLRESLARANQHATASIADFHYNGDSDGWVWNRRPGAWFRFPQFDGNIYPELELPTPPADAICEPLAREPRKPMPGREDARETTQTIANRNSQENEIGTSTGTRSGAVENEKLERVKVAGIRVRGHGASPSSSCSSSRFIMTMTTISETKVMEKPTPQKVEYSPRKSSLANRAPQQQQQQQQQQQNPRPVSSGWSSSPAPPKFDLGLDPHFAAPRTRDRAKTLPQRSQPSPLPLPLVVNRVRDDQKNKKRQKQGEPIKLEKVPVPEIVCHDQDECDDDDPRVCLGGGATCTNGNCNSLASSADRGEISVEELKKRLSQLIGVSLTELEKLFDAP